MRTRAFRLTAIARGVSMVKGESDPHWAKVVLLSRMESTSPTDLTGKLMTNTGGVLDAAGAFGNALTFTGTQRVSIPRSTDFDFGTGDFTIELFVKAQAIGANAALIDSRTSDTTIPWALAYNSSGKPYFYDGATSHTYAGAQTMQAGVYSHMGVCRVGGTLYVFLNGSVSNLGTVTTNLTAPGSLTLGNNAAFTAPSGASIDSIRITKGVGRYTSAFTVPASDFPAGPSLPVPTWYAAIPARTWAVVPTANTLMSIDPAARADLNPNFPAAAPWRSSGGFGAILDAWGTIVPNQTDGRLMMPLFGGHLDYAGNEAVDIDLLAESPAYRLVRRPSGSLPDATMNYSDGLDSTGKYADGRIRSMHPYNSLVHIPGGQVFVSRVGASFPAGNITARRCFYINPDTGEHTELADYSAVTGSAGGNTGGTCYDPVRNCVWHMGNDGSNQLMKTDLNTLVTTNHLYNNSWVGGSQQLVYIPGLDLIAMMTNISGGTGLMLFQPSTGNSRRVVPITGTAPAGWSGATGYSGASWVPELGGIVMWDHDSNTTVPALLKPPASDPYNGTWAISSVPVAADNAVTPTTRISASVRTYGKFGYLPRLKCLYLQNRTSDPLYVFKL